MEPVCYVTQETRKTGHTIACRYFLSPELGEGERTAARTSMLETLRRLVLDRYPDAHFGKQFARRDEEAEFEQASGLRDYGAKPGWEIWAGRVRFYTAAAVSTDSGDLP